MPAMGSRSALRCADVPAQLISLGAIRALVLERPQAYPQLDNSRVGRSRIFCKFEVSPLLGNIYAGVGVQGVFFKI